jgi:hypothetical protein
MMSDEELEILDDVNMLTLEELEYMEKKKKKKEKLYFDLIPLKVLKEDVENALLDCKENHKFKKTTKTKRQSKRVIEFFSSINHYLEKLPSTD